MLLHQMAHTKEMFFETFLAASTGARAVVDIEPGRGGRWFEGAAAVVVRAWLQPLPLTRGRRPWWYGRGYTTTAPAAQ